MAWFENQLQSVCKQELSDQVPVVTQALTGTSFPLPHTIHVHEAKELTRRMRWVGLQTYTLMRTTGCLTDPSTNTYCYLTAATSSNPSDLYFYSLPWGKSLPNNTNPSCSSCTKSVMAQYAAALEADASGELTGLKGTYDGAAEVAQGACGTSYVQNVETSGAVSMRVTGMMTSVVVVVVALVGMGLVV